MAVMMLLTAVPLSAFAANTCDHIYEAQGLVKVALVGKKYVVSDETYKCAKCGDAKAKKLYLGDDFTKFADKAKSIIDSGKYKTDGKEFVAVKTEYAALVALTSGTHFSPFIERRIKAVEKAINEFEKVKDKSENINSYTVTFIYKIKNGEEVSVKKTVPYGSSAVAPVLSSKFYWNEARHYEFNGKWDKKFDNVLCDLVVRAEYSSGNTHDFVVKTEKVDSTCKNEGHEKVEACRVCSFEKGGEVIAKKDHSWGDWRDDGLLKKTHTKTCKVCGESYKECKKEDHRLETVTGKKPTCLEDGYATYQNCRDCNYSNKVDIKAVGHHTEVIDPAVAATCTTPGKTEGKHCSVCKAVIVKQDDIKVLNHDFSKEIKSEKYKMKAATCTTPDVYYKSCSMCGEATSDQTFEGETLAHKFTRKVQGAATLVSPATCTEPAVYKYSCALCGAVGEETYTVGSALGHSWGEWKNNADKKTKTRICSRGCTETTCIGSHSFETVPEKYATCTQDGNSIFQRCKYCNFETEHDVYAKGHKYGTTEVSVTEAAKCLVSGKKEEIRYCVREDCPDKAVEIESDIVIPALGHNYSEFTDDGNAETHTKVCLNADCLPSIKGHSVTEKHDIEKIEARDATCLTDGVEAGEKCEVCSYNTSKVIPAKGSHTEEILPAVAATCTTPGKTEGKKCSVCGETIVAQTDIPANGHTEEIIPEVAATCTTPGKTEGKKCSVCGEMLVAPTEIPATGHDMVTDTEEVPATCLVDGHTKGEHCSRCDYKVESQVIMSVGHHTEEIVPAVAPTCTEEGTTEGKKCSVCGEMLEEYEIIPATGHSMVTTIVKASVSKDGTKTEKCENCDFVETSSIPKISTVVITKTAVAYNGKAQTPTVVVKDAEGVTLSKNIDYKVTYKNNVNPGVGSAVITFIGDDYEGSKTLTFKITPTATAKIVAKQNASAIKVAWSAVKGATGYRVQLYYGKKLVRTRTTDKRTWTFTKLNSGANYKIVVTPFVKSGNTVVYGGARTISTATKPAAPQNVKLAAGKGRIVAQWNKVSGATGYTVFYSLKKDGKYKYVNVKGNKANLKNLKSGRTYYIKVTANKKLGDKVLRSVPTKVKSATVK